MTGSPGSVSRPDREPPPARVLICGVNWVGDTVMSMPAVQAFRSAHPEARIEVLVKPVAAALWAMHGAPDAIHRLAPGWSGLRSAAAVLRRASFDRAYVLPHSFRSALPPFLAGISDRRGLAGGMRDVMLTRRLHPSVGPGHPRVHQAYEYIELLVPDRMDDELEPPVLQVPAPETEKVRQALPEGEGPLVGLIPGAARGPSKEWPAGHFNRLARTLADTARARVVLFGTPDDRALCDQVTDGVPGALNLAGRTGFAAWAAWLDGCDAVVCNDSGGMHLAAALHTPLVAVYGLTDSARTGPLGSTCRILQKSDRRTRDLPRDSAEARKALASVTPEDVLEALAELPGNPAALR